MLAYDTPVRFPSSFSASSYMHQQQQQQQNFFFSNFSAAPAPSNHNNNNSSSTNQNRATSTAHSTNASSSSATASNTFPGKSWSLMETEVRAAAKFLREQLFSMATNLTSSVQLDVFEKTLVRILAARFEGHWFVEEPQRGCGYRAIVSSEGSIDASVKQAATAAKIALNSNNAQCVTLFINPGRVSARTAQSLWDEDFEMTTVYKSSPSPVPSPTPSEN